jgi:hypothetical protein
MDINPERKPEAGSGPDLAGAGEKTDLELNSPSRGGGVEMTQAGIPASEDREIEKRLVRKLDLYLIPLVMSLYLFSFLDR